MLLLNLLNEMVSTFPFFFPASHHCQPEGLPIVQTILALVTFQPFLLSSKLVVNEL